MGESGAGVTANGWEASVRDAFHEYLEGMDEYEQQHFIKIAGTFADECARWGMAFTLDQMDKAAEEFGKPSWWTQVKIKFRGRYDL